MSILEKKLALWEAMISIGDWENLGLNCLYRYVTTDEGVQRFRLNFRDDDILIFEICRLTTDEEKLVNGGKSSVWVQLDSAKYAEVEKDDKGKLSFGPAESDKKKDGPENKTQEPEQKNTKERSS